jgi:hypothetical protein
VTKRYWRYYNASQPGHTILGGSEVFEALDRDLAVYHVNREMKGQVGCRLPRHTTLWETDENGIRLPMRKVGNKSTGQTPAPVQQPAKNIGAVQINPIVPVFTPEEEPEWIERPSGYQCGLFDRPVSS